LKKPARSAGSTTGLSCEAASLGACGFFFEAENVAMTPLPRLVALFLFAGTVLEVDGATAIPYFAWNNRGLAPMKVWLPVKE
jgi:hypothetical protein